MPAAHFAAGIGKDVSHHAECVRISGGLAILQLPQSGIREGEKDQRKKRLIDSQIPDRLATSHPALLRACTAAVDQSRRYHSPILLLDG